MSAALQRAGFQTQNDILELTPTVLAKELSLSPIEAMKILKIVKANSDISIKPDGKLNILQTARRDTNSVGCVEQFQLAVQRWNYISANTNANQFLHYANSSIKCSAVGLSLRKLLNSVRLSLLALPLRSRSTDAVCRRAQAVCPVLVKLSWRCKLHVTYQFRHNMEEWMEPQSISVCSSHCPVQHKVQPFSCCACLCHNYAR
jgi:hypothetical protein